MASYKYDYLGRRVKKTQYAIPNTQYYAYDGDQVIAEYDGSDTLLRKFIYGPGIDEPIYMIDVADGNTMYYYHFDGLGSVAAISDDGGQMTERYTYDVFGEPNRTSDVNNPYLFTGRRLDPETANYYCRARYYKPSIGRFLQTDPIGYYAGLNLYTYVVNNPVNHIDPQGLKRSYRDSYCWIAGLGGAAWGYVYGECIYLCVDYYEDECGNISVIPGISIKSIDSDLLGGLCPLRIWIKPRPLPPWYT